MPGGAPRSPSLPEAPDAPARALPRAGGAGDRLLLGLGVLAVSTATPLLYWARPTSPLAMATIRVVLAAVVLALLAGPSLGTLRLLGRRERWTVVVAGACLAGHFALWISSLAHTSTAASLALVATQPIFAGLIGWVALGERMTRREGAGVAIALVGALALAGGDLGVPGAHALIGDGLALAGAAAAAAYLVAGRRLRDAVPLIPYLAAVNGVAGAMLLCVATLARSPILGLPPRAYVALGIAAVVASVVGHGLLNRSVRRVPVHLVTLVILGEPVGSCLLMAWLFGERPPAHAALGGAIILGGILVGFVPVRRGRAERVAAAP